MKHLGGAILAILAGLFLGLAAVLILPPTGEAIRAGFEGVTAFLIREFNAGVVYAITHPVRAGFSALIFALGFGGIAYLLLSDFNLRNKLATGQRSPADSPPDDPFWQDRVVESK